ncbi:sulfite exporter TauE/SafE family protein [Leptospira sp. WS39.C2]
MEQSFQIFYEFVWGFWPGILVVFGLGFCVGFLASFLGLGGGFIYTPFFHSFFYLSAVQAVAVSLAQMPVSALSGLYVYYQNKKIRWKQGFLLLSTSIPSAQYTAYAFGRFEDTTLGKQLYYGIPFSEFVYLFVFTIFLGILAVYNLIAALKKRKKYYDLVSKSSLHFIQETKEKPNGLSTQTNSVEINTTEERAEFLITQKSVVIVLLVGVFFGMFSSLFGIGGGFLAVPLFIYYFRMSPVEAVATSFLGIFLTSFGTTMQFFLLGKLHWELALIGSFGGIFGARIGSLKAVNAKPYTILFVTSFFQFLVVGWYLVAKLPKF